MRTPRPIRGEIWEVRFNPAVGAEIQKQRPAVVIGRDGIGRLPLQIVVPITDWKPMYGDYSWFVPLEPTDTNCLTKTSGADAFQVKSISFQRFIRRIGVLIGEDVELVAAAIAMCVRHRAL